ncbi:hypothetical protein [Pyxidicoccus caerfyrddinensis]|uniref:hypothetical protein n=1 Tax=Pyxidicoccus caerfyrddinensis TaxID=2709663 RepID=UPI0013DB76FD|nr:hypothetical protein [Pyxidicoccus caerfyrddinensis]
MNFSLMDLWNHTGMFAHAVLVLLALGSAWALLGFSVSWGRARIERRGTAGASGAAAVAWAGAMCPAHAMPARGTCTRCGAFVCAECPMGQRCQPCLERIQGDGGGAVVAPGLSLATLGGLSFFMMLVGFARVFGKGGAISTDSVDLLGVVPLGLPLLGSLLMTVAGIQMARNRSYGLAIAGAVLAIIPVTNACCGISAGVGIWSLVVLRRADVKAVFAAEREEAEEDAR